MVHLNVLLFTHSIVLSFRTCFQDIHNTEVKLTDVLLHGSLCFPFFSRNIVSSVFHSQFDEFVCWPVLLDLGVFHANFLLFWEIVCLSACVQVL